jgi:DNA-binding NtrC family response regulator
MNQDHKRVLIVDDEPQFGELYAHTLQQEGFITEVALSGESALRRIEQQLPDLVISDVRMPGISGVELLQRVRHSHPDLPFLLVTAHADIRDAVVSLKLGAIDYLKKPIDLEELLAAVRDNLGQQPAPTREIPAEALRGVIAQSPVMQAVLLDAWRIARSDATVLLTGPSGAGKDVLADFIHRNSLRARSSLVAVNCAALPGSLLGSELFGHVKGAFSGAVSDRKGRFREAHGGTLFLDEIGDMPLDLQPALLRTLEAHQVTPVGCDRPEDVNVRLIAATNKDLLQQVQAGLFREDLYYRLNVIALELPSLQERPEDILPLARHFLARNHKGEKRLSNAAKKLIQAWPWPGNVRELANAMTRAALLSRGDIIMPEHLPPALRRDPPATARGLTTGEVPTLEEVEIETIRRALRQTEGNRTHAARVLGITRRGLINKIKRFGLKE